MLQSKSTSLLTLVKQALAKRVQHLASTNIIRLFDGAGDHFPRFFIDRLGPIVVLHWLPTNSKLDLCDQSELAELAKFLQKACAAEAVIYWIHQAKAEQTSKRGPQILFGQVQESYTVIDNNLKFLLKPLQAVNAGVFVDTREIRKELIANSAGKNILNTFCYTGLLGLAAYAGAAKSVTQVDISKRMLSWAKENFELNLHSHFPANGASMRFIPEDCFDFIRKEIRRIAKGKEPYDTVIIDPPSFGRADGKAFNLLTSFSELIEMALQVTAQEGLIYISCNMSSISCTDIRGLVEDALLKHSKRASLLDILPPKLDFTCTDKESLSIRGLSCQLQVI